MTTRREAWPPGTPAWADITVPDLAVARAFYGPLLGWQFEVGGPELGYYTQAYVGDRRVVGLGEPMGDDPAPPPAWCVYLATDDLAATVAAVAEAGGKEIVPAMPIMDFGSMAIFVDTAGAVFGVWESASHTGWDVVDEPGAMVWCEVMVHDQPTAVAFYQQVFGYAVEDLSAPGFTYASLSLDGHPAAGVGGYGAQAGTRRTGRLDDLLRRHRHRRRGRARHRARRHGRQPADGQRVRAHGDRGRPVRRGVRPHRTDRGS